ncbi:hypothetical protein [Sporisorium scitamineum]|uniref:Uncharacterized protein n=1 Tax=Sporisorium scitamineum TaxID=49012 RepID=A0A0F7RZC2_9BASI|nr:hypothetical protein [Sporisorium scitamineum]
MSFSSDKNSRRGSISLASKRRGSGTEKLETHLIHSHHKRRGFNQTTPSIRQIVSHQHQQKHQQQLQ